MKRTWVRKKGHGVEEVEDEVASSRTATIRPSHQGVGDMGELDMSSLLSDWKRTLGS